jgi:hypothetical protein
LGKAHRVPLAFAGRGRAKSRFFGNLYDFWTKPLILMTTPLIWEAAPLLRMVTPVKLNFAPVNF